MDRAAEAACRTALREVGLGGQGQLARLLALLRTAPETHLSLKEVVRMAAAAGFTEAPSVLALQLDMLAEHGLLGRLPSISAEPVFDTVPEPHYHLVYEETAQTVDLHVSPETLLAMLRQTLAERPGVVEVMVRIRRLPAARAGSACAEPVALG